MKKCIIYLLSALLLLSAFSGCGSLPASDGDFSVVTTIFPLYDWTRQLLGSRADHVSLTMLLDTGVDLHSYQPSADDIVRISACDLFIYVGGESDGWVEDALKEATNENMIVLDLMDILGDNAKEEELVEGMEFSEEEDAEEGIEYDEHIWLSLKNAIICCAAIEDALAVLDPGNADSYAENLSSYTSNLNNLDARYTSAVESASYDTILFGDRFPFRYLADDYGLTYYAAFAGCSAESEASFETVTFLADKLDELGLPAILILDNSDGRIAKTIIDNTDAGTQNILVLNSMQSTTAADVEAGVTYLSLMEENLAVLTAALQ